MFGHKGCLGGDTSGGDIHGGWHICGGGDIHRGWHVNEGVTSKKEATGRLTDQRNGKQAGVRGKGKVLSNLNHEDLHNHLAPLSRAANNPNIFFFFNNLCFRNDARTKHARSTHEARTSVSDCFFLAKMKGQATQFFLSARCTAIDTKITKRLCARLRTKEKLEMQWLPFNREWECSSSWRKTPKNSSTNRRKNQPSPKERCPRSLLRHF